ncbi:MAG: alpha/beta hydrolase [Pseudomonadota bacterium]
MSDQALEEVLTAGAGGRVFSILTLPANRSSVDTVFVFLNAGLVHRVGPSRMNVRMARRLATQGFGSVRVDLTGKGDTPARLDVDYLATVQEDFSDLRAAIASRLGEVRYVLAGLCSGADNVVRLALAHEDVVGMLLLDPMCYPDPHYQRWAFADRYLRWRQYSGKLRSLLSRRNTSDSATSDAHTGEDEDPLQLRELPSREQTVDAVRIVEERGGTTLAIFTSYADLYYKHRGQFEKTTYPAAFAGCSRELWWREVKHTYKSLIHIERLEQTVADWAKQFVR